MKNAPGNKTLQNLQKKTKKELLIEVDLLRRRLAGLEEAEAELRKERSLTRGLIQALPTFFVATDKQGKVLVMNETMLDALGYAAEEVVGVDLADNFIPERERKILKGKFVPLTEKGEAFTLEHSILTKDGSEILGEWRGRSISNESGEVIYTFGLGIDITERKRMEEELRLHRDHLENMVEARTQELEQANEMLRAVFESVGDAIIVTDLNGVITQANSSSARLVGFDNTDVLIGQKGLDFIVPDDRDKAVREVMEAVKADTAAEKIVLRVSRVDGSEYLGEITASLLKNASGKPIGRVSVSRDVTKRVHLQQRQRLSAEVLDVLNNSPDSDAMIKGIVERIKGFSGFEAVGIRLDDGEDYPYYETKGFPQNFVKHERSLRVRNGKGEILRDVDGRAVLECMCGNVIRGRTDPSQPFFTAYGSFWTNSTTEMLDSALSEDSQSNIRNRCNAEGYESLALIPLRSSGEILGLLQLNDRRRNMFHADAIGFLERLATSISIALGREKTKEILRESEERYRLIFEQSIDAITLIDPLKRELVDFNSVVHENLGLNREEFMNMYTDEGFRGYLSSHEDFLRHLQQVVTDGSAAMTTEYRDVHGGIGFVSARSCIVTISQRNLVLTIWREVSDIRRIEEAESRARELENIDRLRSALLASVSHELRTPLTLIKGISRSLLLPDVEWDEETRHDFLQTIDHESETLTRIVENLEKMSRLEAGIISMDKGLCHVSDIITRASDQLKRLAKDHQLHISLKPGIPQVKADPQHIGDVLIHLLSNAVLFSDTGAEIKISARHVADEVVVSVTDQGIGISEDHIGQVFDRFHRVESGVAHRRGGTGLGLSICKAIIERHDGRIWVESEPGKGSTFSFSLPVAAT